MQLAAKETGTTGEILVSKVPEVTLIFWIIKIFCTTLGETGGDAVTMSMNLGYLVGTAIFAAIFLVAVAAQVKAKAVSCVSLLDDHHRHHHRGNHHGGFCRSLPGHWLCRRKPVAVCAVAGLAWLMVLVVGVGCGRYGQHTQGGDFYWVTIMFSQTLGTALGDWTADSAGLGYAGGVAIFLLLLFIVAACYFWTRISKTVLFWAAFILTRPLGAVVGDLLDKPLGTRGIRLEPLYCLCHAGCACDCLHFDLPAAGRTTP
jgi:Ni,Fe-hydrogenase I cytochrome b subunit